MQEVPQNFPLAPGERLQKQLRELVRRVIFEDLFLLPCELKGESKTLKLFCPGLFGAAVQLRVLGSSAGSAEALGWGGQLGGGLSLLLFPVHIPVQIRVCSEAISANTGPCFFFCRFCRSLLGGCLLFVPFLFVAQTLEGRIWWEKAACEPRSCLVHAVPADEIL